MANWKFEGLDEYAEQMKKLEYRSLGVIKYAVYDGAKIIADAIKANCPIDSGDLRDSLSLDVMKDKNGYIYTKISWTGYDSKGVPNAIKAAVLESGTKKRRKRPFIRPAVNAVSGQAEAAMASALDRKIKEIFD